MSFLSLTELQKVCARHNLDAVLILPLLYCKLMFYLRLQLLELK